MRAAAAVAADVTAAIVEEVGAVGRGRLGETSIRDDVVFNASSLDTLEGERQAVKDDEETSGMQFAIVPQFCQMFCMLLIGYL